MPNRERSPKHTTLQDREYWLIILTSWTMEEMIAWNDYATDIESRFTFDNNDNNDGA